MVNLIAQEIGVNPSSFESFPRVAWYLSLGSFSWFIAQCATHLPSAQEPFHMVVVHTVFGPVFIALELARWFLWYGFIPMAYLVLGFMDLITLPCRKPRAARQLDVVAQPARADFPLVAWYMNLGSCQNFWVFSHLPHPNDEAHMLFVHCTFGLVAAAIELSLWLMWLCMVPLAASFLGLLDLIGSCAECLCCCWPAAGPRTPRLQHLLHAEPIARSADNAIPVAQIVQEKV